MTMETVVELRPHHRSEGPDHGHHGVGAGAQRREIAGSAGIKQRLLDLERTGKLEA